MAPDDDPSGRNAAPTPRPEAPVISPDRQRAFERARRAALALCPGLQRYAQPLNRRDCVVEPESIERYRLLIAAMGVARGTPGGDAVAALSRRGYVVVLAVTLGRSVRVHRVDTPGVVWFGAGLPTGTSRWREIERHALTVELSSFPAVRYVTAHESLRIRRELRQEGHDVG